MCACVCVRERGMLPEHDASILFFPPTGIECLVMYRLLCLVFIVLVDGNFEALVVVLRDEV